MPYPLDYRADDSNCDLEDVEGTKIMQEFLKAGLGRRTNRAGCPVDG